jgi:uncharacterized protein (DUF924 family)
MTDSTTEIHDFWFGTLDASGLCISDRNSLWFSADPAIDETCRSRFGKWLDRALAGELEGWADTDQGLVALVVLLDQFSRNIHRGTAQAFAGDARALALAQRTIASGRHQRLPTIHQVFLYMPLEHCEDIRVQDECVTLFAELVRLKDIPQVESFARYARAHRDVIEQFGRFPHRNAALGRQSSPEELDYLARHGGF